MSVSITPGSNDPYRIPPPEENFSLLDALRVRPVTEGELEQQFAHALKTLSEQKTRPTPERDQATPDNSPAPPRPDRGQTADRAAPSRTASEPLESDRRPATTARENDERRDQRTAAGEPTRAELAHESRTHEIETRRSSGDDDTVQPEVPRDDDTAVDNEDAARMVIFCDFGFVGKEHADVMEADQPYGDDMMILPFPTKDSTAPTSLVNVFSTDAATAEADGAANAAESLQVVHAPPQSTSDETVRLPASLAMALSDPEFVVGRDATADTESINAAAEIEEIDVSSLTVVGDIVPAAEATDENGPPILGLLQLDHETDDTTDEGPRVQETPSGAIQADKESATTTATAEANANGPVFVGPAHEQLARQQGSPRVVLPETTTNSDTNATHRDVSPTASEIDYVAEGTPASRVVASSETTPQQSQASRNSPNATSPQESSATQSVSIPEHIRLAEQAADQRSAGQNSVLVQNMSAPAAAVQPVHVAPQIVANSAPADAADVVTFVGRTAIDEKQASTTPAVENTAKAQPVSDDAEPPPAATATPAGDDEAIEVQTARPAMPAAANKTVRTQETLNPAHQFDRLASLVQQAERQDRTLSVRLHPPELGVLQIDVSERDGVMTARFEVQTQAAQKLLGDSLPKLHDVLAQMGATVERIDVQLVAAEANADRSGYDNPDQPRQQGHRDQSAANAGQFADRESSSQSSSRDQQQRQQHRHDPAAEPSTPQPHTEGQPRPNPLFRTLDRIDIQI